MEEISNRGGVGKEREIVWILRGCLILGRRRNKVLDLRVGLVFGF